MSVELTFSILLFVAFLFGLACASGHFRKCEKCGSRLTTFDEHDTPDMSYGWKQPHLHQSRTCHRCGHYQLIAGIMVTSPSDDSKT